MTGWLSVSLAGLGGIIVGGVAMYFGAKMRFRVLERRFADTRREAGMVAYSNGVAMGMQMRPTFVRDGKIEHWDADAASCLRCLILPSTFATSEEP